MVKLGKPEVGAIAAAMQENRTGGSAEERTKRVADGVLSSFPLFQGALPAVAPHFGLHFPANPGMVYKYPSPNPDILINICSALLAIPKLYTQVLHLMNRMNLVPPFGPAASIPAMLVQRIHHMNSFNFPEKENQGESLAGVFDTPMSESESEYETDTENGGTFERSIQYDTVLENVLKCKQRRAARINLKAKLVQKQPIPGKIRPVLSQRESTEPEPSPSQIFDKNVLSVRKPIGIKITSSLETPTPSGVSEPLEDERLMFGKMTPKSAMVEVECERNEEDTVLRDFIPLKQLASGRLSSKAIGQLSLYETYQRGEPNCRLYIKNLSRCVTEKDLEFIFGSFVDFKDEDEKRTFDVRLMTMGRMRGQAFVGFSCVNTATRALEATNGYQLMGKPMVVQFASFVDFKDEDEKRTFDVRLMTMGRMRGQAFVGFSCVNTATRALEATNGYQLMGKPMVVQFARSATPNKGQL